MWAVPAAQGTSPGGTSPGPRHLWGQRLPEEPVWREALLAREMVAYGMSSEGGTNMSRTAVCMVGWRLPAQSDIQSRPTEDGSSGHPSYPQGLTGHTPHLSQVSSDSPGGQGAPWCHRQGNRQRVHELP